MWSFWIGSVHSLFSFSSPSLAQMSPNLKRKCCSFLRRYRRSMNLRPFNSIHRSSHTTLFLWRPPLCCSGGHVVGMRTSLWPGTHPWELMLWPQGPAHGEPCSWASLQHACQWEVVSSGHRPVHFGMVCASLTFEHSFSLRCRAPPSLKCLLSFNQKTHSWVIRQFSST